MPTIGTIVDVREYRKEHTKIPILMEFIVKEWTININMLNKHKYVVDKLVKYEK